MRVCVCTHCGAIRGGWRVRVRHTCVRRSEAGLKSSFEFLRFLAAQLFSPKRRMAEQ